MGTHPKNILNKVLIALACEKLCRDHSLAEIFVDAICQQAGISRSTFYREFGGKFDIPLWVQYHAIEAGFGEIGRTLSVVEGNALVGEALLMFRNLIRESISSGERDSADLVGTKLNIERMLATLRDYLNVEVDEELFLQVVHTAYGNRQIVSMWIYGEIGATALGLAHILDSCYPTRLHTLLNNPAEVCASGEDKDFDIYTLLELIGW